MTRDEVIRLAREVFDVETDSRGRETFSGDSYGIERFAALVAAQEREACAKACDEAAKRAYKNDGFDDEYEVGMSFAAKNCAAAIRARRK